MRKILILLFSVLTLNGIGQVFDTINLKEIEVSARSYEANFLSPVSFENMSKTDIDNKNYGQEPSLILSNNTSITSFSDAGSGWGYSYIRLRGIDQTHINFSLNGVPLNEPEDQGCYFSNYPDFLQSIDKIQIQRGNGMTKNGVSNFGGSLNFDTYKPKDDIVNVDFGVGSFGTIKTGIQIEKKFKKGGLYIQASDAESQGYKYHSSNYSQSVFLNSYYSIGENTFKINGFIGKQMNDLAYYGVSDSLIKIDRKTNGSTENEKDQFEQYHIQFHHTYLNLNYCIYYNYLKGYYTIDTPDTIYRYDLKSNFIGSYVNYNKRVENFDFNIGLNGYTYNRNHTGSDNQIGYLYTNTGYRNEFSSYLKTKYKLKNLNIFADVQYRYTDFLYVGKDSIFQLQWNFFNYNLGINYIVNDYVVYYNYGKTSREPTRSDLFGGEDNYKFENYQNLKSEILYNQEIGIRYLKKDILLDFNLFYMNFTNELVLNGLYGTNSLPLKENVKKSYRRGFETNLKYKFKFINIISNFSYNDCQIDKITTLNNSVSQILSPKWLMNIGTEYKYKWFIIGVDYRYQDYSFIDFENKYKIQSYNLLNGKIGGNWDWLEMNIFVNNMTNTKYYNNGQMNFYGTKPLYFVGSPINIFMNLKMKFNYGKEN